MKLEMGRPENLDGRLEKEIRVYDLLDQLEIPYERIDHEAAYTMEACIEIDKALAPAVICKNLFLVNSAGTEHFLLLLQEGKKFKTAEVSKQIGSTRLSFASANKMEELLDITPGSVSIMGLMNDVTQQVNLLVDEDVLKAVFFACHPCVNTSSMRLKTEDVFGKFLKAVHHEYRIVKINNPTSEWPELNKNATCVEIFTRAGR